MTIGKTLSVVLSVTPYRESSILTSLFSREHGRLNGVAKGVRRSDRRRVPIERGYLIEHVIYLKPHGDLHTITDCGIVEFYPQLRGDLEKTAIRDLLFDIVLSSVPAGDTHPEVYELLVGFLEEISTGEREFGDGCAYLSMLLFDFAARLGFSLDFGWCSSCGCSVAELPQVWLSVERGLLRCDRCSSGSGVGRDRLFPTGMLQWYARHAAAGHFVAGDGEFSRIPLREAFTALRLAYDYCRYHMDIRKNLASFSFLEHLAAM
jgi:DNA repair protein RecO (recombination protein O)